MRFWAFVGLGFADSAVTEWAHPTSFEFFVLWLFLTFCFCGAIVESIQAWRHKHEADYARQLAEQHLSISGWLDLLDSEFYRATPHLYDWAQDVDMAQSSQLSVHRHPPEGTPSQGGTGPHEFEQDNRGREK